MFELEKEVRNWRTRVERRSSLSPRELDELEDHLRARVDLELELDAALAPHEAFAIAVAARRSRRGSHSWFRRHQSRRASEDHGRWRRRGRLSGPRLLGVVRIVRLRCRRPLASQTRTGIRQTGPVELLTSLRVAAFLSGAAFLACGDGASVGGEPGAPVELEASTIDVLGSSDTFAVVRDLEVLSDGSVWVLNSSAPYFVGFGPDGESLGAHGRSGRGPDEFAMPSAFVTGGWEGEAWVLDLVRHAMIRISRPNADWAEILLRSEALPPGSVRTGMSMLTTSVRTARLGREIIVPRSSGSMAEGVLQFRFSLLRADLVAFDPEAGGVRDLVALGDALDDPSGDFIRSDGGFPLWYRLWASCGENLVRVHDRVRNQLRGFDGSGAEVPSIDLPPVPFTEISPRQFSAAVFALRQAEVTGDVTTRLTAEDSLRLLNQMAQRVQGEPHELASYLPRYVDFRCSEDGTMWLHPLDLDAGGLSGGRLWLRIAADGATRDVRLPDRFDAFRFSSSRIWGVSRDEFDRPSVASIPFQKSP